MKGQVMADHVVGCETKIRSTLRYPKGFVSPRDFLRFIQLGSFQQDWERLGLDDDDLRVVEAIIMASPVKYAEIENTGGFRIIRLGAEHWDGPKCDGVVIGYAYFPESSVATLLVAETDTADLGLTTKKRAALKRLIKWIGDALAKGA